MPAPKVFNVLPEFVDATFAIGAAAPLHLFKMVVNLPSVSVCQVLPYLDTVIVGSKARGGRNCRAVKIAHVRPYPAFHGEA